VKLVGGANQLEGNVIALNPKTGVFGPVCDDGWNIQNVGDDFYFGPEAYLEITCLIFKSFINFHHNFGQSNGLSQI